MKGPPPSPDCPFLHRLTETLYDCSATVGAVRANLLFSELLDLEEEAVREDAPDASLRVISTVRELAGRALAAQAPRRTLSC